jgi:hypothetical protein
MFLIGDRVKVIDATDSIFDLDETCTIVGSFLEYVNVIRDRTQTVEDGWFEDRFELTLEKEIVYRRIRLRGKQNDKVSTRIT